MLSKGLARRARRRRAHEAQTVDAAAARANCLGSSPELEGRHGDAEVFVRKDLGARVAGCAA
jgi:hypothetical protein